MMNARVIVYIACVAILLSCSACNEKKRTEKELEVELRQFKEKAILFPDNLQAAIYGRQEDPDTTLLHRAWKMVVYVDKSGCTGCKLRTLLPVYMFMLENKSDKDFGVVVILNTPDKEETAQMLTDLRFRHTVFFDADGAIERLNPQMPKKEEFHMFLLNGENKVVLIGNPTHNEKLNRLYLSAMKN